MSSRLSAVSELLRRIFGRRAVLLATLGVTTLMFAVLVPAGSRAVTANTTRGPRLLDEELPTWTSERAVALMDSLGPDGRATYQDFYLRLDFWFPVLSLSVFLVAALSLLYPATRRFSRINLLPILLWSFDMAENVNHFTMAARYPAQFGPSYQVGPILTLAKWVIMAACVILIVVGLVRRVTASRVSPSPQAPS